MEKTVADETIGCTPGRTDLRHFTPDLIAWIFTPNDKTNLAPYRVVHLASLVFIVVSLMPADWPGLKWPIFKPLIRCGEQSLPVFCVGLFLSFIAHFVFHFGSEGVLAQLLVGAAGLGILTIIAYYSAWSKAVDESLRVPQDERGGSHRTGDGSIGRAGGRGNDNNSG